MSKKKWNDDPSLGQPKRKPDEPSHEEISRAVADYLASGGAIHVLLPQAAPKRPILEYLWETNMYERMTQVGSRRII